MAKVIVCANQKGGVGKSTLAVLTANHLSKKGIDVGIIEIDVQRSVSNKRKSDIRNFGDENMPYEIRYQEPKTIQESTDLMSKLKSFEGNFVFLIDLPGKIDENYIAPFLVFADYIICPFQYENMCLASTTTFMSVVQELKGKFETQPQLVFVPNNIDTRIGTKVELEGWKQVEDIMDRFGSVTGRIPATADLRRINTYENTPKQEDAAIKFLNYIDLLIGVNS